MTRNQPDDKANVALTECALAAIHDIEKYSVDRWGRATAIKYVDEISRALDLLRQRPNLLKKEPGISSGLYFYRVQKHVLVCDYRQDSIVVLTVIPTSMDLPSRLAELEPRLAVEVELLHNKLHRSSTID